MRSQRFESTTAVRSCFNDCLQVFFRRLPAYLFKKFTRIAVFSSMLRVRKIGSLISRKFIPLLIRGYSLNFLFALSIFKLTFRSFPSPVTLVHKFYPHGYARSSVAFAKPARSNRQFFSRSFSLIEVLAALVLFVFGFLVFLSISQSYFRILRRDEDRLLAAALAHEGLELVMAKRNLNVAEDKVNWLDGLPNSFCVDKTMTVTSSANACRLFFAPTGFYLHSGSDATATKFSRRLEISRHPAVPEAVTVIAEVIWPEDKLQLQLVLTSWHPRLR